jgi:GDP-4-dehydro-6-deoxy-D-mannose reductase
VPPSPYGLSKLAQDQIATAAARDDRLDVVIARPFNHAGPGQDPAFALPAFARQIALAEAGRGPRVIRVGNLDARRDIADVRDVVEAYTRIVERAPAGRPFNVCTGQAWRIGDLLEDLLSLSSTEIKIENDPARWRPNDVPLLQGDRRRIESELGWRPAMTMDQTLKDTLDWWRRRVAADA